MGSSEAPGALLGTLRCSATRPPPPPPPRAPSSPACAPWRRSRPLPHWPQSQVPPGAPPPGPSGLLRGRRPPRPGARLRAAGVASPRRPPRGPQGARAELRGPRPAPRDPLTAPSRAPPAQCSCARPAFIAAAGAALLAVGRSRAVPTQVQDPAAGARAGERAGSLTSARRAPALLGRSQLLRLPLAHPRPRSGLHLDSGFGSFAAGAPPPGAAARRSAPSRAARVRRGRRAPGAGDPDAPPPPRARRLPHCLTLPQVRTAPRPPCLQPGSQLAASVRMRPSPRPFPARPARWRRTSLALLSSLRRCLAASAAGARGQRGAR